MDKINKCIKKALSMLLIFSMIFGCGFVNGLNVNAANVLPDAVSKLEDFTGLTFSKPYPELVSEGTRMNILKLAGQKTVVTVKSTDTAKKVSFDFKYNGTAESYGGLYFSLYRTTVSDFDGLGGAILPAWTNANLMTNMYQPNLVQQQKSYEFEKDKWYSCVMELDSSSMRYKVYEVGTDEPTEWTMKADVPKDYLSAEQDCNVILKLDGTVSNVAFYLDDICIEKIEDNAGNGNENGSEGGSKTDNTSDPGYTYFFDDFEDYEIGKVVKKNMPAKYNFDGESYQIVQVEGKGNVLQGNAISKFYVDCSIVDKEVSFDFSYSGTMESYSGLYVKLLVNEGGVNEQYFSINPGFETQNIIVSDTHNANPKQEFTQMSIAEGKWYSVKSRMINQKIYVKVWETESVEPEAWSSICEMSAPVTDNKNALFWIEMYDTNTSTPLSIQIDNLNIKTWDELQAKTEYKIQTRVNDEKMGTVSGEGTYLEGNTATLKATANKGYEFVSWTDEEGTVLSTKNTYSFKVTKNLVAQANFQETVPVVKSFMADGMTVPAKIDTVKKTVEVVFASDVDMTKVRPYFYIENADGTELQPYSEMDLSSGTVELGNGWTVNAKQNRVMQNFYVDCKNGSDSNDGTTLRKAFATIEKAKEAVRSINTWTGDVLVNITDGEYILSDTLKFDEKDSAENGCSVIYRSLSGKEDGVIISSGIKLEGWKQSNVAEGAWEIDASQIAYSRDLYVDGERAVLARTSEKESIPPDGGWGTADDSELEMKGDYGYIASGSKANLYKWKNQSDIEFVYEVAWTYSVIPVTSIENNGDGTSKIIMHKDAFYGAQTKAGRQIQDPNYIQNAFELLDEENEWYFDRTDKKIYYIPETGKNPNELNIVIPTLDQLITVEGTKNNTVDGIAFKDITFEYTSYLRPHTMGQVEIQANFVVDPDMDTVQKHDNYLKTPGGVTVAYATGIRVAGCTFRNFSASGLDFEEGVVGSTIVGNDFYDISASGIQVGGVKVRDAQPYSETTYVKGVLVTDAGADPDRVTEQILVMSNELENIGADYKGSIGIFAGFVRDITISHNKIYNTPYSGISAGWGWGYWDEGGRIDSEYYKFDTPTIQERYVIENNHISKVCSRLADGGAIYTLSFMPGSIIRGNVLIDCKVQFGGIYNDEAAGGFVSIENNIAQEVHTPYFYHLVANFSERQTDTLNVKKNNSFDVGGMDTVTYNEVMKNAGLQDMAADRTFAITTEKSAGGTLNVTQYSSANETKAARAGETKAARAGEVIKISATAEDGYRLQGVYVNGELYEDDILIVPDQQLTISAAFTKISSGTSSNGKSDTTLNMTSNKTESTTSEKAELVETAKYQAASTTGAKTGDSSNTLIWIVCAVAAVTVLTGVCRYRKKERQ